MTLLLHAGAEAVSFDNLRHEETPEATRSHVPIPHYRLVDMIRHTLSYYGHEVVEEHHGLTPDGMRYFGVLSLESKYGDYEDTVGLRNSHDKRFPVGISMGARVFVCDNLSFMAEHVIKRKHTVNALRDLPSLVSQIVEPLAEARKLQEIVFQRFKETPINSAIADWAIMEAYRQEVINVQRIADVHREWVQPANDYGSTAWTLFNAFTSALEGKVAEKPVTTQKLHNIIDVVCEVAEAVDD